MHEQTERSLARLVFVVCCALPTWCTVAYILVSWTPWYHQCCLRTIEKRLSTETGLLTEVGDFTTLSPTASQLNRVRLYDPETGREVARVAQIDWSRQDDQILLVLQQPELQASMLRSSWKLIHDRFLCRPDRQTTTTRFVANDLTLHWAQDALTLRDVQAWIEPQPQPLGRSTGGGTPRSLSANSATFDSRRSSSTRRLRSIQATVTCVPASHVGSPPIRASIRRDLDGPVPKTRWTLDTGDIELPCSALLQSIDIAGGPAAGPTSSLFSDLGTQATFTGSLTASVEQDQWAIENLSGDFDRIMLDEVFQYQTHRLSGVASLHLDRCEIVPSNQSIDIDGSITADNGVVGRSLLYAASNHLNFDVKLPEGNEDVLYDRMAFQFRLNGPTLRLGGSCRHQRRYEWMPQGVVARAGNIPLAISSSHELPAIRLMSLLAPAHSQNVPVSWQNHALLPLLAPSRPIPGQSSLGRSSPGQSSSAATNQPLGGHVRAAQRYRGSGPLIQEPIERR